MIDIDNDHDNDIDRQRSSRQLTRLRSVSHSHSESVTISGRSKLPAPFTFRPPILQPQCHPVCTTHNHLNYRSIMYSGYQQKMQHQDAEMEKGERKAEQEKREQQRQQEQKQQSSSQRNYAIVVGVGPGLGASIATRFACIGYDVAICARQLDKLKKIEEEINQTLHKGDWQKETATGSSSSSSSSSSCQAGRVYPFTMDCSDEKSVKQCIEQIQKQMGADASLRVLVYNAGMRKLESETILDVKTETFEQYWRINCLGAFHCIRACLPIMLEADPLPVPSLAPTLPSSPPPPPSSSSYVHRGSILLTGATASIRSMEGLSSFAVGKFGLRALSQSCGREYGSKGIHVAHVVVDGAIDSEWMRKVVKKKVQSQSDGSKDESQMLGRLLQPAAMADEYVRLHQQHPSCWSHEIDIRPYSADIIYSRV